MTDAARKRSFDESNAPELNDIHADGSAHVVSNSPALMTESEKKWCTQTIKALKKHKFSVAFRQPVDPVFYNIPDYFDIIKNPMDLGTVEEKLQSDEYATVDEFKSDVQLVFDNCYLYNNPGDPVTLEAKKLEEYYHKLLKKEPPRVAAANALTNGAAKSVVLPTPAVSGTSTTTNYDSAAATTNTLKSEPTTSSLPQQPMQTDTPTTTQTTSAPAPAKPIQVKLSLRAAHKDSPKRTTQKTATEQQQQQQPVRSMPEDQWKRCVAIVKELKKPRHSGYSWPFLAPVDVETTQAYDYYDVIKHPMDMSTYEKKLYDNQYTHQDELLADIRLMFQNCRTYNPPGHLVIELAKEFEANFEKQWKKLLERTSSNAGRRPSSSSASLSSKALKKRKMSDMDTEYIPSAVDEGSPSAHQILPTPKHKSTITTEVTTTTPKHSHTHSTINESATTATDSPTSSTSTAATGTKDATTTNRPILRLKLSVKPKDEKKEESQKNTTATKAPGSALSKELFNPKLAINNEPPSALKDRGSARPTLAISKPPPPSSSSTSSQAGIATKKASPPPAKKEPALPTFDINAVYNQIHNEKKLKEQQKREEQEKWERNERIRLEKERLASEERMKQLREFNQHLQAKRQQDKVERMRKLNSQSINISKHKLTFTKFEQTVMLRDKDWHDMCDWQKQTIDYRHIPTPGFVKRAPLKISEIRARLLSRQGRLRSQTSSQTNSLFEDDAGSDMDID